MRDKYKNFSALSKHNEAGKDYRVVLVSRPSATAVVAPHGGRIEPTTSEIARAIAGEKHSLYCFEGLGSNASELHITSSNFDEPNCQTMLGAVDTVIGVHGRADRADASSVWMGGRDTRLRDAIGAELKCSGFDVTLTGHDMPGTHPANICNRGRRKMGVQLEIPMSLRDRLRHEVALMRAFASGVQRAL